jgi:hypothetical protein
MNEVAPAFFGDLQEVLWNDVLLHLARLTDPPGTSGQQNLTVRQYPRGVARLPILEAMNRALDEVEAATGFARDWRNRRLAHLDLEHARNPSAKPLAPASRADVERALKAIRDVMQTPESHFRDNHMFYDQVVTMPGRSWELLYHLESGLGAEHDRRTRGIRWMPKYL